MENFQTRIFHVESVTDAAIIMSELQKIYSYDIIEHELLSAISLKPSLLDYYSPYLHRLRMNMIPNMNPILCIHLFRCNLLSFDEVNKMIPKYLKKEKGEEVPSDYEDQIQVNFGGPLAVAIFKDDLAYLQNAACDHSFSFDQYLPIEDDSFRYISIPLLSFAAQKNAFKCFKFLLLNGSNPYLLSNAHWGGTEWNTLHFATSSGAIHMMSILENYGMRYDGQTGAAAARFRLNSMLDWLASIKNVPLSNALLAAAEWNNIKGVQICLDYGANINITNEVGIFKIFK